MRTQDISASNHAGWKTALDVILAPNAAFERLRAAPTWFWAFLIAAALGIIGSLLVAPAFDHYVTSGGYQAELAKSPRFAQLTAEQRDKAIASAVGFVRIAQKFNVVIVPISILVVALIQALVMLIASAIAKGKGTFGSLWAAAMNVAIVGGGLYAVVNGIIIMIHGSDNFTSTTDFTSAVPSLGMLVPTAAAKLHAFFAAFHVFSLWAAVLLVIAMQKTALMGRGPAIVTAALMLIVTGIFATFSAN